MQLEDAALLIENDRILSITAATDVSASDSDEVFDLQGATVMPGLIDIHTHGADGSDFSDATEESLRHMAKAKLREGVTSFFPTSITLPHEQLAGMMRAAAAYRANQDAAKTPAVHIEGPYINIDCVGAQNPAYVRTPDINEILELDAISPVGIVSLAAETEGAVPFIERMKVLGITTSLAHTAATYAQFTSAKTAGLTHLTHFCNQMTRLHHREIGIVGAGLLDRDIMIELICDTIHLAPDMIQLVFALKPLEQLMLITDSVSASWLPDGTHVELGGLEAVVQDRACRLKDGTLAGSTLRLNEALRNVHFLTSLPLQSLVRTTSFNQAQSLGLPDLGKLEAGAIADIAVLDDAFDVVMTLVDGEVRYSREA
ncbi:MAG: N-acetylglucosamine-6-phosphate deacetylase [Verrucomicrobiales bacterium]|jgi:N-acetylglucosamine-6-phosphate deacetylase